MKIVPRIVASESAALVGFVRRVFDARGELQQDRPSYLQIGDSAIMISEAGERERFPAFLYVYVNDADATYRRALDAGATSIEPPWNTPYGDRRGMFRDRWDNVWQVATRKA